MIRPVEPAGAATDVSRGIGDTGSSAGALAGIGAVFDGD